MDAAEATAQNKPNSPNIESLRKLAESQPLAFLCTQVELEGEAHVVSEQGVINRFQKWEYILNTMNERVQAAIKEVEHVGHGKAAEFDNLRNIMHTMEADFNTRLCAYDKELSSTRTELADTQNTAAECKQVLAQVYERLLTDSNAIRPFIQAPLKGAAAAAAADDIEVQSISSNEDETADLNESADSSHMPAVVQVVHCAQSVAQPNMPEPIPSGSEVAPTAHAINDSAESHDSGSFEADKENNQPANEMVAPMSSTPIDKKKGLKPTDARSARIVELIECDFCDAGFKKKKWLTEHMIKFHAIKKKRLAGRKHKHDDTTSDDGDDSNVAGRFVALHPKRLRAVDK